MRAQWKLAGDELWCLGSKKSDSSECGVTKEIPATDPCYSAADRSPPHEGLHSRRRFLFPPCIMVSPSSGVLENRINRTPNVEEIVKSGRVP